MQRSRVDRIIIALCAPRILGLQGTALTHLPLELLPGLRQMLGSRTASAVEMAIESTSWMHLTGARRISNTGYMQIRPKLSLDDPHLVLGQWVCAPVPDWRGWHTGVGEAD